MVGTGGQTEPREFVGRARMQTDDERLLVTVGDHREPSEQALEAVRQVDILGPMKRDEKIPAGLERQTAQHAGAGDLRLIVRQDLEDRVPRHEDPVALHPLANEVVLAADRIREQDGAAVIDDAPVDFLRHAVVVTAVARFHVVDRNAHAGGDNSGQSAVGVAENQDPVGPQALQQVTAPGDDLPRLVGEAAPLDPHLDVGSADTELAKEQLAETLVVVLARMDQRDVAERVEGRDDPTQPDDFGACAEDDGDLHATTSVSTCVFSTAFSASRSMVMSAEEYSPVSAGVEGSSGASSGSIGWMT